MKNSKFAARLTKYCAAVITSLLLAAPVSAQDASDAIEISFRTHGRERDRTTGRTL